MLKKEVEEKMAALEKEILAEIKIDFVLENLKRDLGQCISTVQRCQVLKGLVMDYIIETTDMCICEAFTVEETVEEYKQYLKTLKRIDEIWGNCDVETDEPVDMVE